MTAPGTFSEHVVQAALPVLKICLLGSVGALLAACGILDRQGRRTLSKLIYFVFTPALTFSKLAPVLTAQHLLLWMPLAVNMFLSVGVGLLLGALLLLIVGAPPWFRKHVIVATALGNAGNLPLVLVAALLRESGGVIFEGQNVSVDLAIAYVAMGIWAATLTHFTVGTHMLKVTNAKHGSNSASSDGAPESDCKGIGGYSVLKSAEGIQQQQQQQPGYQKAAGGLKGGKQAAIAVLEEGGDWGRDGLCNGTSFCSVELATTPASHTQQQVAPKQHEVGLQQGPLPTAYSIYADSSSGSAGLQTQQQQQDPGSGGNWLKLTSAVGGLLQALWEKQQQQQKSIDLEHGERIRLLNSNGSVAADNGRVPGLHDRYIKQQHQQYIDEGAQTQQPAQQPVSSWGRLRGKCWCAAAAVWRVVWDQTSPPMVGCLLAVAVGMMRPVRDQLFATGGHLLMIQDCIEMFSACCIPCLLLMMGATLAKGPGKACPPWRVVLGVCTARLVLMPLLGTGWILLAHQTGWLVAPDSMFLLVMLIQNAVPTALNVHTLATLHANREEEVAALLFWQYLTACLTVPAALMFFLWLLKTPALGV